jgi:hypothetical protein
VHFKMNFNQKKLSNQVLIILYVISTVGFILKILSNDAYFILTFFIYFKYFLSKKKHVKRGHIIHWNGGTNTACETEEVADLI